MGNYCNYQLLSPTAAGDTPDLLAGKKPEDAMRRIQALLADWLRMENLVVLTAAGCSVEAGGRLMAGQKNNLEYLVLDVLAKCDISENEKAIINWKKSTCLGKGNFEEWLSYLFNASSILASDTSPLDAVLWKNEGKSQLSLSQGEVNNLCNLIEKAIYAECALQLDHSELLSSSTVKTSGHIPFLAKLITRDANLGRTHLFTLNYDTLFEQAMEELGIQYFDGFSGKASSRFDPSVYGLDIYYPGDVAEGRVRRFDKFLQFYKLHGSVHWIEEDGILRAQHRDLSAYKKYRDMESSEQKAKALQSKEYPEITSFGILPTSKKFSQTLDMPYAHLFRLFHARLNQPQTFLIVLGYGFTDNHVTRIIETALMNPSLVMLVVEPNPKSKIVERIMKYQNLGQRAFVLTERLENGNTCSYKVATFSDFSQNIMPDIKWFEDFKRLRKFEDQIRQTQDGATNKSSKDL